MSPAPSSIAGLRFNCADQATVTWVQRAELCADFIQSIVEMRKDTRLSVADIGCGDQKLQSILRTRGVQASYTGYDLVPQVPEVRQFDVSADDLPDPYDVAVLLGVIEYLDELNAALNRVANRSRHLILSHVIRKDEYYSQEKLTKLGWRNHLSESELDTLLTGCGFEVRKREMTPDGRTQVLACYSNRLGAQP